MRADNKNAISKIKKRISIAEIRYKYSYIFRKSAEFHYFCLE